MATAPVSSWVPLHARVPAPLPVSGPVPGGVRKEGAVDDESPSTAAPSGGAAAGPGSGAGAAMTEQELRELSYAKLGTTRATVVNPEMLQHLPDVSRRETEERRRIFERDAARTEAQGGGIPSETRAHIQALRAGIQERAPPGAAIVQVLSAGTALQGGDAPLFRVIRVYIDTPSDLRRRRGVSALEYARAMVKKMALRPDLCGLPYLVVPTGVPWALPLGPAHTRNEWHLRKGERNMQRAVDIQMALADSVEANEAFKAGTSRQRAKQRVDALAGQTQAEHRSMVQRSLAAYRIVRTQLARRAEAEAAAAAAAAATGAAAAPAAQAEWTMDESGVPGATEFPEHLRDARQTMVHLAMGLDLDTVEDAAVEGAPPLARVARGLEPWVVLYPWAYASDEVAEKGNRRASRACPLRAIHCLSMYQWASPLTFELSMTQKLLTAQKGRDLGTEAVQAGLETRERIEALKDMVLDAGKTLEEVTVDVSTVPYSCDDDCCFAQRCALTHMDVLFGPGLSELRHAGPGAEEDDRAAG